MNIKTRTHDLSYRRYPYTVTRICPKCKKPFEYIIEREAQAKYYPRCIDCCERKPTYWKGKLTRHAKPPGGEPIVDDKEALFNKHDVLCDEYRAQLIKHKLGV